jgi:hypothetical protein
MDLSEALVLLAVVGFMVGMMQLILQMLKD